MKKRGRRCLISLLLGLCLLMPSQMNALAADAQGDSSSVQAVEEAMPDQENVITKEKSQSDSTKQDNQTQTDDRIQNSESESEQQQKNPESGNASADSMTNDVAVNETTGNQDISVLADHYPATGKITAKIYLRYSNTIPADINQDFGVAEFGPSGNNTPYFTVTVDLDQLNKKPVKTYTEVHEKTQYIYYSIDSDGDWNPGDKTEANRIKNATNLWEQAILQAMDSTDQKKFENVFGSNMFVGYVLKRENDGWHIDGILKKDPPVYVVELYDQNDQALFAISSNDQKLPGVPYAQFKQKVEEVIGGSNYQYEAEQRDRIVLIYEKDGRTWKATITPKTDGKDKDYAGIYHVDPVNGKFSYRTVSRNTYYLSRMKIKVEDVTPVDLIISKTVKGSAANPSEHFTFTLTASKLAGKTFHVLYTGNQGCEETHASQITFDQSGVARIILKNGESAKIQNITAGDISIKEESGDYWTSVTVNGADKKYDQEKGIVLNIGNTNVTAAFTNQMEQQPVTGISMMTFPYLLILGLTAIAFGFGYVRRKRNV